MSCMTRSDAPYYGLLSDTACSGQGVCVNATGVSQHFDSLCICNDYYSGESDMFDLRVAQLPNGTWLSLDCPNPRVGVLTVFSLQLIFVFMRQLLLTRALIAQCRFKGRMSLQDTWAYIPYRVLLMETFVANPIILGLPIQKIIPAGLVIGTDVGPTICLVLGTFLGSWAYNDFEYEQFRSIVKATSMDFANHKKLLRRQRFLVGLTRVSYCVFGVIPSLVALGLDKSLGPIASGEFITLLMRNVGIGVWLFSQWAADALLQKEISQLSGSLLEANRAETLGSLNVLNYLHIHAKKTKSTAIFGCLIWIFFCLPFFWPFQGYAMTIVTCITMLRTANEGIVLLQSARISKQSELSNNSNAIVDSGTSPTLFPEVNLQTPMDSPGSPLTSKRSDLLTLSAKQTSGGIIQINPEDVAGGQDVENGNMEKNWDIEKNPNTNSHKENDRTN